MTVPVMINAFPAVTRNARQTPRDASKTANENPTRLPKHPIRNKMMANDVHNPGVSLHKSELLNPRGPESPTGSLLPGSIPGSPQFPGQLLLQLFQNPLGFLLAPH